MIRKLLVAAVVIGGLASASGPAHAVGCFTGALAGGAAGHMAHHGVLGALGGCIAGHTWHKHQMRKQDLKDQQSYQQRQQYYSSQNRTTQ